MVQRLLIENLGYISFQQLVTLHPTFHFSAPYKDKTYRNSTGFVHRLPLAKRIGRHGLRQLGMLRSGLGNRRGVFCDLRLHPLSNRQSFRTLNQFPCGPTLSEAVSRLIEGSSWWWWSPSSPTWPQRPVIRFGS